MVMMLNLWFLMWWVVIMFILLWFLLDLCVWLVGICFCCIILMRCWFFVIFVIVWVFLVMLKREYKLFRLWLVVEFFVMVWLCNDVVYELFCYKVYNVLWYVVLECKRFVVCCICWVIMVSGWVRVCKFGGIEYILYMVLSFVVLVFLDWLVLLVCLDFLVVVIVGLVLSFFSSV